MTGNFVFKYIIRLPEIHYLPISDLSKHSIGDEHCDLSSDIKTNLRFDEKI